MNKLVRYATQEGVRAALVINEGSKWIAIMLIDAPVRVRKVPKAEGRYMTPIPYTGRKRRVENAFLAAGKGLGITPSAKRALK